MSHLAISATVVGAILMLVFLVWYPSPYFDAVGAWSVVRVLVGVDLVLGPLLTLIVFRPRKPGLLLDVSVIATVQAVALVYGVSVLYQERPYYLVFSIDRLHVLARKDVAGAESVDWIRKPLIGPQRAAAVLPEDPFERNRILEETLFEGAPDIERRAEFWVPYEDRTEHMAARAAPLSSLRSAGASVEKQVDGLVETLGVAERMLGFLPINSRDIDVAAIIDLRDGEIVDVIAVDPWPLMRRKS